MNTKKMLKSKKVENKYLGRPRFLTLGSQCQGLKRACSGTGVDHQRHLVADNVMVSGCSLHSNQIFDLSASPYLNNFVGGRKGRNR